MGTCAVACEAEQRRGNARYISIERDVFVRRQFAPAVTAAPCSSSMRHDDVLPPARERMKLSHCPRERSWLLGPRIPGTVHLNQKEYHRRNELSLERPRHFRASSRRRN